MSRTDSDIQRRVIGPIPKPINKDIDCDYDITKDNMPEGGCPYYGDVDKMAYYCGKCEKRECY